MTVIEPETFSHVDSEKIEICVKEQFLFRKPELLVEKAGCYPIHILPFFH